MANTVFKEFFMAHNSRQGLCGTADSQVFDLDIGQFFEEPESAKETSPGSLVSKVYGIKVDNIVYVPTNIIIKAPTTEVQKKIALRKRREKVVAMVKESLSEEDFNLLMNGR